jgi:hypothetical protein
MVSVTINLLFYAMGRGRGPAVQWPVCAEGLASVLATWAKLGETVRQEPKDEVPFEPLRRMIYAAERDGEAASRRLGGLFEQSELALYPGVGDPLSDKLSLGSHRWLAGHREESYSDWLAWIIERQDDSSRVLRLFGIDAPADAREDMTVDREVCISDGRPDLVIRHPLLGVLCIEVKTKSEPREGQLEDYRRWLAREGAQLDLVLLAVDLPEDQPLPEHCRFCSWKQVSLGLRAWASGWLPGRQYDAVMTLAFCGAVERNLLSLGRDALKAARTADYLEEVLDDGSA